MLYLVAVSLPAASRLFVSKDERVLGTGAGAIADFVETSFSGEIVRVRVLLAAATFLAGALLGVSAAGLVALRDVARPGSRPRWSVFVTVLVLCAMQHVAITAWSMALHPQIYASSFYDHGGVWRAIEVAATDSWGPRGMVAASVVLASLFVLGGPRQWLMAGRRLGAYAARHTLPIAVGLVVALGLLVDWPSPNRAARSDRPNIVILASDSLRADRLRPDLVPRLYGVAARGTLFERAYVTLPRTFPSWMTILTGRHAHHHGVRSTFARWEERSEDFDALPTRLAREGYRTAVVSDFAGDIFGRVDVGFADRLVPQIDFRELVQQRGIEKDTALLPFIDTRVGRAVFPALQAMPSACDPDILARTATSEIKKLAGGPFLLTVFFSTTHFPYAAPYPYYHRYTDPHYQGIFRYAKGVTLGADQPMEVADIRQVRALYDGAVASVDRAAGTILDELVREGIDENTIVLVTADHGENIFEPGRWQGHGDHLFGDEATHVPLIVFDPRRPVPHREKALVSSVDIAPTLYELAGVRAPANLDGRSLARAVSGEAIPSMPAFAETELWLVDQPTVPDDMRMPYPHITELLEIDRGHADQIVLREDMNAPTLMARHRMVRDDRYKLIYIPTRAGVRYLLFDTETDPHERKDVFAAYPEEAKRLEGMLWTWMLEDPMMRAQRGYLLPKPERGAPSAPPDAIRIPDSREFGR
jgi:arylsulfatase A-like enzyme